MALETEITALFQGIKNGTEGREISTTTFDEPAFRVVFTLDNGRKIYASIDSVILSAMES